MIQLLLFLQIELHNALLPTEQPVLYYMINCFWFVQMFFFSPHISIYSTLSFPYDGLQLENTTFQKTN